MGKKLLLDTHVLIWAAASPERLGPAALAMIEDAANGLFFSVASLWEIAIKAGLGKAGFNVDPGLLRSGLKANGYAELAISGEHTLALQKLPAGHKDPFDRMLLAQAITEGMTLLTADALLMAYPGPILRV